MRLRRAAQSEGAEVFLTLEGGEDELQPRDWGSDGFPQPGSAEFRYKAVRGCPQPQTSQEALVARVNCANQVYRDQGRRSDVYFLSLHFDSTSPRLSGVSFYYPYRGGTEFVDILARSIREAGRARQDADLGGEYELCQGAGYAVLSHSDNPDSYLIELGNLRSREGADLWKMRTATTRGKYAEMIMDALRHRTDKAPRAARGPGRRWRAWQVLLIPLSLIGILALALGLGRRLQA